MQSLIAYFERMGFSESELTPFLNCIKTRQFKTHELILYKGQVENYLSFVDEGLIRYYVVAKDKEITIDFAFQKSFYCAYDSFYDRSATQIYIEALTDTQLYSISYKDLQNLYSNCEITKKIGRLATEYLLSKKIKREINLLTKSPQERYEELLREQPKYIIQIPLKFIASFLGVVPETLSRIRKRIT